jgi:hypothetical protein
MIVHMTTYMTDENYEAIREVTSALRKRLAPQQLVLLEERQRDIIAQLVSMGDDTEEARNQKYQQSIVLLYLHILSPHPSEDIEGFLNVYFDARGLVGYDSGTPLYTDDVLDSLGCIHYLVALGAASASDPPKKFMELLDRIPENMLDWRGGITQSFMSRYSSDDSTCSINNNAGD